MPYYEVFIPAKPGSDTESVSVEVEASSWLLALRTGMHQIGEQGDSLASIMCENRSDGTVVVKDPDSRRMFRIKEVEADDNAKQDAIEQKQREKDQAEQQKLREQAEQAERDRIEAERVLAEKKAREKEAEEAARLRLEEAKKEEERKREHALEAKKAEEERKQREREEMLKAEEKLKRKLEEDARKRAEEARQKEEKEKQLRLAQEKRAAREAAQAAMERAAAEKELREREKKAKATRKRAADSAEGSSREVKVTRTKMKAEEIEREIGSMEEGEESFDANMVMADLFMDTMDIVNFDEKGAANFILDLALRSIEADAASVILSDFNSALSDLYFAAARGKVADKLFELRIPRGKGIVGFSVEVGCAMSVSDARSNPNFYKEVGEKTGFETRSLLCVPVQDGERTYGAIELINKIGSNRWEVGEMNVVQFLAQKLGEHLSTLHDRVSLE